MKGYRFVQKDCPEADFWLTACGSISQKYHAELIGCISLSKKNNPKMLQQMILNADPKTYIWTADELNKIME